MKPLTIFTFGYWGWGNSTEKLVQAVNKVELSRRFEPPLFVDIRISRSVRAIGFNGDAFKRAAQGRYKWMGELGNSAIQTGEGRINIRNPHATEDLLSMALENYENSNRRILFFCSCKWPGSEWHQDNCHRVTVASLLLKSAARREHSIEVVEWPGGEVGEAEVKLTPEEFRKVRKAATIPLTKRLPSVEFLKLAWGSLVTVRSSGQSAKFFTGPAQYQAGHWFLPKIYDGLETEESIERGLEAGAEWRKRWGFEARNSGI